MFVHARPDHTWESLLLLLEQCFTLACELPESVAHGVDCDAPDPEEAVFLVFGTASLALGEVVAEVVNCAVGNAIVHSERVGGVAVSGIDKEGETEEAFERGFDAMVSGGVGAGAG